MRTDAPPRWPDDRRTEAEVLALAADVARRCAANAAEVDREGAFPVEEFRWIAEAGLLAVPLRREVGGLGLGSEPGGTSPLLNLLKRLGRGNLSVGRVYEGHVNALLLIHQFGTPEHVGSFAAEARAGRLFAVWNTEIPGDGVKLVPIGGGRFRLEGSKTFASGAGHVDRPFVNGALPDGSWQMCVVPMDRVDARIDPSWWRPLGMRASASFRVDFDGVEVGEDWLIGRPGDYLREPWFSGGAIRFAAVQLGGAEALLEATRAALRDAGRADDPYQRHRVGRMAIAVESGNQWLRGASAIADRPGAEAGAVVAYARMARTAIEEICQDVLRWAESSVGALGLIRPHPIERIGRDLTLYLRQPAPDAALAAAGRFILESKDDVDRLWSGGA